MTTMTKTVKQARNLTGNKKILMPMCVLVSYPENLGELNKDQLNKIRLFAEDKLADVSSQIGTG